MWYGSPQWQIDAFWRFQIPESLEERFGYPELDTKTRLRILGLNSAKINDAESLNSDDRLAQLRNDYGKFQREEGPARSNSAYGWIRATV